VLPLEEQPDGTASTKFSPEYIQQAFVACSELGANQKQLATLFGVGVNTISIWKRSYPAFKRAITTGVDEFDSREVEGKLLQRAMGYEYEEIEVTTVEIETSYKDEDGKRIPIKVPGKKIKVTNRKVPAHPGCLMYWLNNRQPDRWQSVKKIEATGKFVTEHRHDLHINLNRLKIKELESLGRLLRKAELRDHSTGVESPGLPGHHGPSGISEARPLHDSIVAPSRN